MPRLSSAFQGLDPEPAHKARRAYSQAPGGGRATPGGPPGEGSTPPTSGSLPEAGTPVTRFGLCFFHAEASGP